METGNEIKSAVKNIKYYSERIGELAKIQFEKDCSIGDLMGIAAEPGSVRFECLGCVNAAAEWIDVYCDNILANVKHAEKLDDKLRPPIEDKEKEQKEEETPEVFR